MKKMYGKYPAIIWKRKEEILFLAVKKYLFMRTLITATGNHSQATAKKLGIKIPAIPVEHQYIVTEKDPELQRYREKNGEHPVIRDADAKWYVREERAGWILGPYEKNAPAKFEFECQRIFEPIFFRWI